MRDGLAVLVDIDTDNSLVATALRGPLVTSTLQLGPLLRRQVIVALTRGSAVRVAGVSDPPRSLSHGQTVWTSTFGHVPRAHLTVVIRRGFDAEVDGSERNRGGVADEWWRRSTHASRPDLAPIRGGD